MIIRQLISRLLCFQFFVNLCLHSDPRLENTTHSMGETLTPPQSYTLSIRDGGNKTPLSSQCCMLKHSTMGGRLWVPIGFIYLFFTYSFDPHNAYNLMKIAPEHNRFPASLMYQSLWGYLSFAHTIASRWRRLFMRVVFRNNVLNRLSSLRMDRAKNIVGNKHLHGGCSGKRVSFLTC